MPLRGAAPAALRGAASAALRGAASSAVRGCALALICAAGPALPGTAAAQAPSPPALPPPPIPVPVPILPPGAEPSPGSPGSPPPPPPSRPGEGCRGVWVGGAGPPGPGVSRTALGRAPAPYEVGRPAGRFRGRPPRGVMLLIHGGGWYIVGPAALATERGEASRWRRRGWLTVNLDYPACAHSVRGVLWFHDRVRRRHGARIPLCASGASAGGHLALMVAALRRGVDCVIARGAPTDLRTIGAGTAASGSREGSRAVGDMGRSAFGDHYLGAMSPVAHARTLRARILLATHRRDVVIPLSQARALRRAVRRHRPRAHVESILLDRGRRPWIHGAVTPRSLARFHAAELRLVAPLLRGSANAAAH